jgi:hypothetical protein
MSPQIHLIDETWIDRPVEVVVAAVAAPSNWPLWWPQLQVAVSRDRGLKGIQWAVTGSYTGTAEIWLEPVQGGVLLHHYLRLDAAGGPLSRRRAAAIGREFAWQAKRVFWALKDDLENNR